MWSYGRTRKMSGMRQQTALRADADDKASSVTGDDLLLGDTHEQLHAYLDVVQAWLRRAVARSRVQPGPDDSVADAGPPEVRDEHDGPRAGGNEPPLWERVHVAARMDAGVSAPAAMSPAVPARWLPIGALRQRFDLNAAELAVFVLALAPELVPSYGEVFAWLHRRADAMRPTFSLALDILCRDARECLLLRGLIHGDSALFRARLLILEAGRSSPRCDDVLIVDPELVDQLLRGPRILPRPALALSELTLAPSTARELMTLGDSPAAVGLCGSHPGDRQLVAAALTGGRTAVYPLTSELNQERFNAWLRDVRLGDCVPCIDAAGLAEPHLSTALAAAFEAPGGLLATPIVLADSQPVRRIAGVRWIEIAPLSAAGRMQVWARTLGALALTFEPRALQSVASSFRIASVEIIAAAHDAARAVRLREGSHLDFETWARACRDHASRQPGRFADRLRLPHGWDDLVLPRDRKAQLAELTAAIQTRERVLETWQFGDKVATTSGVTALFHGPSGTGKTMAAGILANHLGMELYRIELSRVVSKYIGETEKNLDAVFDEAERAHAVLFFDEADALFGKRSEVKDAHDRYANIEVAYLLQRMESYQGVTILASNLRQNLDEAFLRRLQFVVEFPYPSVVERNRIWNRVWPSAAPLGNDVDLDFLAARLELTGGQIRNIALMAAYLAAARETPIGMAQLIAATRREYQKLGRVIVDDEFGHYRHLLHAEDRP